MACDHRRNVVVMEEMVTYNHWDVAVDEQGDYSVKDVQGVDPKPTGMVRVVCTRCGLDWIGLTASDTAPSWAADAVEASAKARPDSTS